MAAVCVVLSALLAGLVGCADAPHASAKVAHRTYLKLPPHAGPGAAYPRLLSQTGALRDPAKLTPASGLLPYDLKVPFWSDGAAKTRWISVPENGKIGYSRTDAWSFPAGTVFVKTFTLATNDLIPENTRRLETRLLVCGDDGAVYGLVYKWRPDNSDADLLETNLSETIPIRTTNGFRQQVWYYPSRADCLTCHTRTAGQVLGVTARQMNREFHYRDGDRNQLAEWNRLGLFRDGLDDKTLLSAPALVQPDDRSQPLELRARSYLDANCAHCHRPGGTVAYFDARFSTPPERQNIVNGRVLIDERIDHPRLVAPNDLWRSILYMRTDTVEPFKMPPLARNTVDTRGVGLLREWITNLPGPPVLAPPRIFPVGGNCTGPLSVTLTSEPGATVHYTLDGTAPAASDPVYEQPLQISPPVILRARAFKPGFTKSITAQEIYLGPK